MKDRRVSCTGAIYPPYHVVLAAHCIVALGATVQVFPPQRRRQRRADGHQHVITAANHPLYEIAPTYVLNDVAVLTLRPPEEGDAVRAAGIGLVVDGGFPSDGALFVDQPALTPREAAGHKRDVQDPRNYPDDRDGPIPPGEALDHLALL
ncbi:hypothetical protein I4F81_004740 [Pyropia yezoensis]|uniref:Uncharacterized protein n=1 Tax=Pyropia yezoensis TaxID=2788 RepID=A0ACC3BWA6_PYRYE|nr:hypothetical protein I4F81_004740 [Neopyropia yezoensis]